MMYDFFHASVTELSSGSRNSMVPEAKNIYHMAFYRMSFRILPLILHSLCYIILQCPPSSLPCFLTLDSAIWLASGLLVLGPLPLQWEMPTPGCWRLIDVERSPVIQVLLTEVSLDQLSAGQTPDKWAGSASFYTNRKVVFLCLLEDGHGYVTSCSQQTLGDSKCVTSGWKH